MSITLAEGALIAAAGFVSGSINAVAGGGALVSFPALVAIGLPPLNANVTNTVAAVPGYFGGALGYRRELPSQRDRIRTLVPIAAVGGLVGGVTLLVTPASAFKGAVPFLILFACVLLALQPRIQAWVLGRPHDGIMRSRWALYVSVFASAIYGAYFGGALGVVLLAVLGIFIEELLQKLNAVKSVLQFSINIVAALVFTFFGPVEWLAVAIMAPAAVLGGYLGASVARHLPPAVLRGSVVAFGTGVATYMILTA